MTDPASWSALPGPLHAWRAGHGPRVVFLHGFTQTSYSWRPIAGLIASRGFESVIVDLPGHGGSAYVRADLRTGSDLLAPLGPAVFVGYSLGGRFALHTALAYPSTVRGLVLIGVNPGIDDELERARRRAADDVLAAELEHDGVDVFLERWVRLPLFGGLDLDPTERESRLTNSPAGLSSSLRLAGTGTQLSLWPRLVELNMPVIAVAGEADHKFVAIARQIADLVPDAEAVEVIRAAHAAHLQQPEVITQLVLDLVRSPRLSTAP